MNRGLLNLLIALSLLVCVAAAVLWLRGGRRGDVAGPALTRPSAWSAGPIDATKRDGDVVADALMRFEAAEGHFPQSLSDLAPKYLPTLPAPSVGNRQWKYRTAQTPYGFILSATGDRVSDPELSRTATSGWVFDDK